MTSTANCFAALTQSKAMERPEVAQLTFDDSHLAVMPQEKRHRLVKHRRSNQPPLSERSNKAAPIGSTSIVKS